MVRFDPGSVPKFAEGLRITHDNVTYVVEANPIVNSYPEGSLAWIEKDIARVNTQLVGKVNDLRGNLKDTLQKFQDLQKEYHVADDQGGKGIQLVYMKIGGIEVVVGGSQEGTSNFGQPEKPSTPDIAPVFPPLDEPAQSVSPPVSEQRDPESSAPSEE
ncbi:hypothetical protein D5S18_13900 [Nocardia panacis]|uniref:Uncharacterized protein n=2 Tax=Nocardia panacis TaxID=2340916 RepID=A0A3A4KLP8_9NOCA|nr:hypothetical protein D5S18_13900 [Nocardia panacis]